MVGRTSGGVAVPRLAKELGVLALSRIVEPGLKFVGVVPGLGLHVTKTGARCWLLRVMVAGKRREMGLGNYPGVTLAQARDKAREARELIAQGVDPIGRERAAQSVLRASVASAWTFKQCSEACIGAHETGWRSPKHRRQ